MALRSGYYGIKAKVDGSKLIIEQQNGSKVEYQSAAKKHHLVTLSTDDSFEINVDLLSSSTTAISTIANLITAIGNGGIASVRGWYVVSGSSFCSTVTNLYVSDGDLTIEYINFNTGALMTYEIENATIEDTII